METKKTSGSSDFILRAAGWGFVALIVVVVIDRDLPAAAWVPVWLVGGAILATVQDLFRQFGSDREKDKEVYEPSGYIDNHGFAIPVYKAEKVRQQEKIESRSGRWELIFAGVILVLTVLCIIFKFGQ
jgi:hypothetical protein